MLLLLIVNIAANIQTSLCGGRSQARVELVYMFPFGLSPAHTPHPALKMKMRIYSCITFLIKKRNVSKVILSDVGLTHLYPEMLSWVVENEMK